MRDFLTQWDFIVDHLEEWVSTKALRDLMFRQLDKSTASVEDMAHYKRAGPQHGDRSYAFQRDAIERHIKHTHQRKIVDERRADLQRGNQPMLDPSPAAPAVADVGSAGRGAGRKPKRDASRDGSRNPKPRCAQQHPPLKQDKGAVAYK